MGTASLIAGIGFMLVGFAVIAQAILAPYFTIEQMIDYVLLNSVFGIPLILIGAALLTKYDRDKKKEKNS